MKEYIRQFYNDGLAAIFYKRPITYINKKIKNKGIVKLICLIIKVIYTIFAIGLSVYILYRKLF